MPNSAGPCSRSTASLTASVRAVREPDAHHRPKHPRTRNGLKAATTDVGKIQSWWKAHPDANIGILTGAESGLVVIDVDLAHGGVESMQSLAERLGNLPPHPMVQTGGGGFHAFFRHPGRPVKSRIGIADGVDIRADGAYVVGPYSVHISRNVYSWKIQPDRIAPPELPEAWLAWLVECHLGAALSVHQGRK